MTTAADLDLMEGIRSRLVDAGAELTPVTVAAAMRAEGRIAGDIAVLEVLDALRRDTIGAGPLDELLRRPGVTDVLVNGPRDVYIDDGDGLRRTPVTFDSDASVRRLAQRLAAHAGRRLDDASPYVDVRLRDGTRFHALLAPIASPGTCLSLRVPARRGLNLDELVSAGLTDGEGARLLVDIVASRAAFVISGGTGSGKTTLLAAMLAHVGATERLVVVEDSAELRPPHPHVVALESRQANVEGVGEITMRDLVRQALRMRPDRLVIGEVRGSEVVDMLAAMNTGHDGGCATLHANSARDVPARLEALAAAGGLTRDAVHAQIASALQLVIQLARGADGVRRLVEIAVLDRNAQGSVSAVSALRFAGAAPVVGPGAPVLVDLLDRERPR